MEIERIVREVAELPDRNSPEDQPEMMLVTAEELRSILSETHAQVSDGADELRAALKWAMPLVEIALEDCRQMRLRNGHSDIGAGTNHVGLWPFEVTARDNARALANGGKND